MEEIPSPLSARQAASPLGIIPSRNDEDDDR